MVLSEVVRAGGRGPPEVGRRVSVGRDRRQAEGGPKLKKEK